jgi:uncharacterized protein YoaH (UPF0181 family)
MLAKQWTQRDQMTACLLAYESILVKGLLSLTSIDYDESCQKVRRMRHSRQAASVSSGEAMACVGDVRERLRQNPRKGTYMTI